MVKLVHEIGISDVAVAKACLKVGLPLADQARLAKSEMQRIHKSEPPQVEGNARFLALSCYVSSAKSDSD